jgi:2-haloacid dehalogenase
VATRAVAILDVNETLSDLSPLGERFEEVGAPPHLLPMAGDPAGASSA